MRRLISGLLLFTVLSQWSGSAALAAAPSGSPGSGFNLSAAIASLRAAAMNSQLLAQLTGQGNRYAAMHAPAPQFPQRSEIESEAQRSRMRDRQLAEPRPLYGTRESIHYPAAPPLSAPRDPRAMRRGGFPSRTPIVREVRTGRGGRATSASALAADATASDADAGAGLAKWWTYEETAIPGVGKAMANVGTGNLVVQADDVDIPGRGLDLAFRRTFNSQSLHNTAGADGSEPALFGNGWTNNLADPHLVYRPGTTPVISYYDGDGTRYDYTGDDGVWTPPDGMHAILEVDPSTTCAYWLIKPSGTAYWFHTPDNTCGVVASNVGRLYKIVGRNANDTITLQYSWSSTTENAEHISQIVAAHSDGQSLVLTFAKFGSWTELSTITRPDGSVIRYSYDTNGNLAEVDKPGNPVAAALVPSGHGVPAGDLPETYYVTAAGLLDEAAGPLATIAIWNGYTGDGGYLDLAENASAQVTGWSVYGTLNIGTADGSGQQPLQPGEPTGWQTWYHATFAGYGSGTTSMTDTDGHATTWGVDSRDRVTSISDWNGSEYLLTTQSWGPANNMTASVDPRGNETDYSYDSDGDTVEMSLPAALINVNGSNETIRPTSFYSYDAYHNVIAYCDPVWSANNGKTWTGATSSTSLCPGGADTTRYGFTYPAAEPYGELTATTTPLGYQSTIAYDAYGQPTSVTGSAMAQPDGTSRTPVQNFAYDGYGDLTSYNKGTDSAGKVVQKWTMTYDTLNRVIARTDGDSVTTRTCYNADGSVSATTTASQYALDGAACGAHSTSYQYDADGDQTQIVDHKGGTTGTTTKVYDGLDRLVEVTQPYDSRSNYEYYSFKWMTRYLYDLTGKGAKAALAIGGASGIAAYGGLYKTQEFLPSNPTITVGSATAAPVWTDVRGNSFDPLDRSISKYETAFGSAGTPAEATNTYDCNDDLGLLCQTQNGANQTTTYDYDNDGHTEEMDFSGTAPLAANRVYRYDPDGRAATIDSASMGTIAYAYDLDGNKTSVVEPGNQGANSTISYTYYPDGLRKDLSIAGGISQNNMFAYSYREDGLLQTQAVNWTASGGFAWTYTQAGREATQSDPLTGQAATTYSYGASTPQPVGSITFQPKSYTYDAYGRTASLSFPQGYQESATVYDVDDELTDYNVTSASGPNAVFQQQLALNARGELLAGNVALTSGSDGSVTGGSSQNGSLSANGALMSGQPTSATTGTQSGAIQIDARSGMALVSQYPGASGSGLVGVIADGYDPAGRQTTQSLAPGGVGTAPQSPPLDTRSYDADNHITADMTNGQACFTNSFGWGPDGQLRSLVQPDPLQCGGGTSTYSLHWDGDTLLFSTAGAMTALYIGKLGTLDSTGTWTIFDRDQTGLQQTAHGNNNTGGDADIGNWYAAWSIIGPRLQNVRKVISVTSTLYDGNCGAVPAGSISQGYPCPTPSGALVLTTARSDGYNFGTLTFQGVRVYDSTSSQWLTPDAYAGDADDPMSQKPFMWNGNNPIEYSDPSGYVSQQGLDGSGSTFTNEQSLFTDSSLTGETAMAFASATLGKSATSKLAQQGNQSAVPTGLQVEPSQTKTESKGYSDFWYYQLTNADGQPVTGKGYQAMENVAPAVCGDCTSNAQWVDTVGTEIQDEVGGTQSSISFQTFDVKYEGEVYSLPQELVHEVDVGPNGEFSTRVYEIVPDAMP